MNNPPEPVQEIAHLGHVEIFAVDIDFDYFSRHALQGLNEFVDGNICCANQTP